MLTTIIQIALGKNYIYLLIHQSLFVLYVLTYIFQSNVTYQSTETLANTLEANTISAWETVGMLLSKAINNNAMCTICNSKSCVYIM